MKANYNLLLLLFLVSPLYSIAQSGEHEVTLQVSNLYTATPIENATIFIKPCECGGVTDSNGFYTTTLPEGEYRIHISHINYTERTESINLNKDYFLEIGLVENEEQLSEVIITAKKTNDNLRSPQMGVINLESQDLKKIPAPLGEFDVLRSMTLLAGVNNAGEVSNGISIRGSSLDQNLILYDYAPVFNPTHLFGLFSVFTPDMISSTDLYKANVPARYGGRIASVVDIKVKNPYVDKFKLSGGVGIVSSRLAIETPIVKDKLMLGAGIRGGFTGFLLPIVSKRLKNTKARFADGTLKLLYLPTKSDQISFTGFYSTDFYQLDLISQIENINSSSNQYNFSTLNGTLNWLHSFDSKTNLRTIVVGSNYTPQLLFPEAESSNKIVYDSEINYWSLTSEMIKKVSEDFDYYGGIQATRYKIYPGSLDPGSSTNVHPVSLKAETSYELSSFANINWQPLKDLEISAGLRYTHYLFVGPYTLATYDDNMENIISTKEFAKNDKVKSYDGLEPRVGTSLMLTENLSVKTSYVRLNQYLHNIYNSTSPIPTSRWKTSDPFIQPQTGDSYSIGFYRNFMDNAIEMSLEGYYKKMQNVLTYKPGADFFLEEFLEQDVVQGQGRAYGLEYTFRKPNGRVNGWFNYTWSRSFMRSQNENLGDRINNNKWFSSDFDIPHVLNATLNLESTKYSTLSFNFTMQSGRPYTIANGFFNDDDISIPIFLERNNARLRTYHRLDLSWKIKSSLDKNARWKSDWTFSVYNVYSRKNPFNKYYSQAQATSAEFSNGPLSSFEIYIMNSPLFALSYNFTFN